MCSVALYTPSTELCMTARELGSSHLELTLCHLLILTHSKIQVILIYVEALLHYIWRGISVLCKHHYHEIWYTVL